VKKRGIVILSVIVLLGAWLTVVGYEFLQKENARFQKNVKAAKEEQQRCVARNSKYRNYDQFRTSIRLPYTSDLPVERWMHQYDTLHAGMSESEVEIILGAPDYTRCDVSKQGDKFVGSMWMYAVAVPQDVANESQNSGIQIVFGPDGKLTDKNAMNMQAKASPTPTAAVTPNASATPVAAGSPSSSGTPAQDATPPPSSTPSVNATPAAVPSATPATTSPQGAPAATATPTPQI
jgi:hypothetical protein